MNVTVFEDPCPQSGHSMQEFIDNLCKRSKEKDEKE